MTNFGMDSMRLKSRSAAASGRHWARRRPTSAMLTPRDFSVSKYASGTVTTTREARATTAIAMEAAAMVRVMARRIVNAATAASERIVWLTPAR